MMSADLSMPPPPPPPLPYPPAIYLCKRTMQNKARLELADYEAVSPLLCSVICVEVLAVTTVSCFLSLCCKTNEFIPGPLGPWKAKMHHPPPLSKKLLSNYRRSYKS